VYFSDALVLFLLLIVVCRVWEAKKGMRMAQVTCGLREASPSLWLLNLWYVLLFFRACDRAYVCVGERDRVKKGKRRRERRDGGSAHACLRQIAGECAMRVIERARMRARMRANTRARGAAAKWASTGVFVCARA